MRDELTEVHKSVTSSSACGRNGFLPFFYYYFKQTMLKVMY